MFVINLDNIEKDKYYLFFDSNTISFNNINDAKQKAQELFEELIYENFFEK